ncbi:MAG: hypothetical protein Q4G28_03220 [Neisseria sp.]|nr:hypothetical protein [Neisseria sp.]
MAMDTTGWREISLGYHSFLSPPDFTPPQMTARVGSATLHILRDEPRSFSELVQAQDDTGDIVRHIKSGDWDIFVTREDSGLVVSSYTFLVFGMLRIGPDVVLTRDSMSRSEFPQADDDRKWQFHRVTTVTRADAASASDLQGFILNDLVFLTDSSVAAGEEGLIFQAFAAARDADQGNGSSSETHNNYEVTFIFMPHDGSADDRLLTTPPDISTMPGVTVNNRELKVDGADAVLSRVEITEGERSLTTFDGAVYWFGAKLPAQGELLVSAHSKFVNDALPANEAETRAMAMLTSIRRRR